MSLINGTGQVTKAFGLKRSVLATFESGQTTLGGIVSVITVNVKEQFAVFPDVSTADVKTS